jgi:hypothetical protein
VQGLFSFSRLSKIRSRQKMKSDDSSKLGDRPFKQSILGILSVSVGLLSILVAIALILFDWFREEIFFWIGISLLAILGIGLGIGSLTPKNNKKMIGILGCSLNGVVLVPLICYISILVLILFNVIPVGFRDGCIFGTAKAWIDQNENGNWDINEPPLAGVEFFVINNQQEQEFVDKSTSDKSGEATLLTFPYTCDLLHGINLVVQATPPNGYRATTSEQVIISGDKLPNMLDRKYYFGFIKQSSP